MSTSYGLINSQGIKFWKSTESFCLSILTIYANDFTQMNLLKVHIFTAAMFFFSMRFLNVCKPRTTFHLLWWAGWSMLAFYGCGPASLLSWLGMVDAGLLGSMRSEIFLQVKFIIFQDCSTKQGAFLPGWPAPYNQLLVQPLLLVAECYSA